jgi:hypothetical protein
MFNLVNSYILLYVFLAGKKKQKDDSGGSPPTTAEEQRGSSGPDHQGRIKKKGSMVLFFRSKIRGNHLLVIDDYFNERIVSIHRFDANSVAKEERNWNPRSLVCISLQPRELAVINGPTT